MRDLEFHEWSLRAFKTECRKQYNFLTGHYIYIIMIILTGSFPMAIGDSKFMLKQLQSMLV